MFKCNFNILDKIIIMNKFIQDSIKYNGVKITYFQMLKYNFKMEIVLRYY